MLYPLFRGSTRPLALSVCLLTSFAAWSQSYQGGLRGMVMDGGGAIIGTAKVTLTNEASGVPRSTLSNASGEYVFNSLEPATYLLMVETPGFKKFEKRNVVVGTQQFLTIDAKMELGAVTESIMVTEEVPLIESANASTGQVIDRQKLVDLPNLGRNPFMMSKIAQNVIPAGNPNFNRMQDQSGSSQISIAGGPVRGNNYLLDGVPITDAVNRAVIIPTIESVQEVKVQANTYDAEMGRTGGGVFNTYLKSGGNRLNGSGFGYIRQTDWMANTYFNNRNGKPIVDQPFKNYGGSIGGPISIPKLYDGRNRSFFFIGAEAYRQISSVSNEFAVPTLAEIGGNFSLRAKSPILYDPTSTRLANGVFVRDAFPGNSIPSSRISAVGANIAKTYPLPTKDTAFGVNNIAVSTAQYDRADQLTGKFDQTIKSWWRLNASYLHYGSREPGENWFGTVSSPAAWLLGRKVDASQINNTLTLGATAVLNIRYGFNRFPNNNYQRSSGFNPATLGFSPSYVSAQQRTTFPDIAMQTFSGLGVNNNDFTVYSSKNFMVSASKFLGRHSFKAGYDYRRLHITGIAFGDNSGLFTFTDTFTRASASQATAGTGSDLASLLLGFPDTVGTDVGSKLNQYVDYNAFYVHDDFRVTSKLTLNLGLRYEYETGLKAQDNALLVGFDPAASYSITAGAPKSAGAVMYAGTNGYNTQTGNLNKNKLSPRIGVVYQLNAKTTVRGGYGLFWAPIPYSLQTPIGYTQTNAVPGSLDGNNTPALTLANLYPSGLLKPAGNSLGYLAGVGSSVTVIDQHHRAPFVHQYSFDVQRELPWGIGLVAGYVGTYSGNMILGMGSININQLPTSELSRGVTALTALVNNPFYRAGGPGIIGASRISLSQSLRPYPQFQNVNLNFTDSNTARYDSLVIKAQKRLSQGLSFVSTWTWSKNQDGSFAGPGNNLNTGGGLQNSYNPQGEYGLAIVNSPHRLSNGVTYELPFGKNKLFGTSSKTLDRVAGGWSLNFISILQTGFPLAIRQNSNNNSIIGGLNQRPNATGISPEASSSFADRLDGWINPAAFSQAPALTFGNVSRTIGMRTPGQVNWDTSLFKTLTIMEHYKIQFRLEALNTMNTPLFRSPETRVGNSNFGKITSQANFPRMLQMGLRFFF